MIVLLLIVIAFLVYRENGGTLTGALDLSGVGGASVGSVSFSKLGPGSDPRYWYDGIKPGTVTVGGQPAPSGWAPDQTAQKSLSLIGTGIGTAEGIAGTVASLQGSTSVLASSTALGAATLGIGLAVGVVSTVVGLITAHHKAAVAKEGATLNAANPVLENDLVLVVQGVLNGEIATQTQANQFISQIVADFYTNVHGIERGTYKYALTPTQDPSILAGVGLGGKGDPSPGTANWFSGGVGRPDPCNAACWFGHYSAERNAAITKLTVAAVLKGQHGAMTFPKIGPNGAIQGFPEVTLVY